MQASLNDIILNILLSPSVCQGWSDPTDGGTSGSVLYREVQRPLPGRPQELRDALHRSLQVWNLLNSKTSLTLKFILQAFVSIS